MIKLRHILIFVFITALLIAPLPAYARPIGAVDRPMLVIQSYSPGTDSLYPGDTYTLHIKVYNSGKVTAQNVVASFTPGEVVPLQTGGVVALGEIGPNERANINQPITVGWEAWGKTTTSILMTLTYVDSTGTSYTDSFALSMTMAAPSFQPTATPTPAPTNTPVPVVRPQIVIASYKIDMEALQPGVQFIMQLNVQNLGNANARRVTMIVGGGSTSVGDPSGTGQPNGGGTNGGDGAFGNFAPVGSSNVQSLGDIKSGQGLNAQQAMIVNVTTAPGAYSMRVSFSYLDDKNRPFTDDQVITLLVYSLPNVDIDFYRKPGDFYAGQPNALPLQIVNLGRRNSILGNMRVTTEGGMVENGVVLIGSLDPGGYFPLDATLFPNQAGPLDLVITVDYTDDFNQAQKITKVININVLEAPVMPVGPELTPGAPVEPVVNPVSETLWDKILRFIRGMLGLDSGIQSTNQGMPGEIVTPPPGQQVPSEKVVPVAPLKGP